MQAQKVNNFIVAIIGGGPAGMMAAIVASRRGASVVLIEKNKQLGAKLLLTGKGRCNITSSISDDRQFIKALGKNGVFLFSGLSKFNCADAVKFFNDLELETKVERGQRVFPKSDKAYDVLRVLMKELKKQKVAILLNTKALRLERRENQITKILTSQGEIMAQNVIIASGGLSYPATGSTGDGYNWAKSLSHEIIEPRPCLVPIIVKENFIKQLEGLSLKNVKISLKQNNKIIDERFGEALFTGNGMSGPIILDLSKTVGENLPSKLTLTIDFKPALDEKELDARLQNDFQEFNNKLFKNSLNKLLPKKLIPIFVRLSGIDENKQVNKISKVERQKLLKLFKNFELEIVGLDNFENAIITCGGVNLKEIDQKTMKSKIIDNLYFCGEILDLDGPTGGYNLQICWTTGYVAGSSVKI